jgi:DNA-directed RNA polymerase subunit RPC12/RpoP
MVKCNTCGEELTDTNWSESHMKKGMYNCKSCYKKHNALHNPRNNPRNNPKRMYVNGKYISTKHPLYKPGKYKTFNDAAFSSLVNYVLSTEGEVYILKNPAWDNWYKIGKAVESVDRCNQYQTGSPHRDYELVTYKKFKHRGVAEKMAHSLAEGLSRKRLNEWFYIENLGKEDFDKMLGLIDGLIEEKIQNDRTSAN